MKATESEAIFGGFDGATSLIGFLAGALVVHASSHAVLVQAAGLAVAAAVSMAGADLLAGKSRRLAAVMGLATLAGSLLPAVPVVLVPGPLGVLLAAVLVAALGVAIAETRSRAGGGRRRGYVSTFAILVAASGLAAVVSVALGVAG